MYKTPNKNSMTHKSSKKLNIKICDPKNLNCLLELLKYVFDESKFKIGSYFLLACILNYKGIRLTKLNAIFPLISKRYITLNYSYCLVSLPLPEKNCKI